VGESEGSGFSMITDRGRTKLYYYEKALITEKFYNKSSIQNQRGFLKSKCVVN